MNFLRSVYLIFITLCGNLSASNVNNANEKSNKTETQAGNKEAEKTLNVGILEFPPSQQPNPMVSFGQNILNQNQGQLLLLANEFNGNHQYFINIVPSILYGLTDSLSLFISTPIAVRYKQENHHSSGVGDISLELEYAFYTRPYRTFFDQATLVAYLTFPTGSMKKSPPIGLDSSSFFIGYTYSRTGINWFGFTSSGCLCTTSHHRTKFGDQFLYQFGLGRRILNTKKWLFAWMVEFDGIYTWKDRISGIIDQNSGGNVIYITPSLWLSSSENLIFQLGIGYPVQQHLFGHQNPLGCLLELNAGWTF